MTETQKFFIAILDIISINVECEIRTSDEYIINIIKMMDNSFIKENYICCFCLTEKNKKKLLTEILTNSIEERMHSVYIRKNNHIIFEAYDGFEIGEISRTIKLSADFVETFVATGLCRVSNLF